MAVTAISQGENLLIRRNLFQSDGTTPLPLTSIASIVARLVQTIGAKTYVQRTYKLGVDIEIRQGPMSTNQLELEITAAQTQKLAVGTVTLELDIVIIDPNFKVDPGQSDVFREDILEVAA